LNSEGAEFSVILQQKLTEQFQGTEIHIKKQLYERNEYEIVLVVQEECL
jgi:hypothetical protein